MPIDVPAPIDDATDTTGAIRSAIAALGPGDGTVRLAAGIYRMTETIDLPPGTTLQGEGQTATIILADHAGTALRTRNPVNSSVAVNVRVKHLGIHCARSDSEGAGYEDNCGTYIHLHDVAVVGFRWGVIFDQTEVSDIDLCNIGGQSAGGAAIWLTNGDTRTAGAVGQFTNRISVTRCQINVHPGAYGIIDEGGVAHSYWANNFNIGGVVALYLAGVVGGEVRCCEFEGGACGYSGILEYRTFYPLLSTGARGGVGGPIGLGFHGNQVGGTGKSGLCCVSAGNLALVGNSFGGTMPIIDSAANVADLCAEANGHGAADPYPGWMPEPGPPGPPGPIGPEGPCGPQGPPGPSPLPRIRTVKAGVIPAGQRTTRITHELGGQPAAEDVAIIPTGPVATWVANIDATTVTVQTASPAPTGGRKFTLSASRQP